MQIGGTIDGAARTFLVHMFGRGLDDGRYVVERFQSMADGDIRRWPGGGPKGRRRAKRATASLKAVKEMRPAPDEIIVCTALNLKGSGIQIWGCRATGLFVQRRQR